MKVLKFGGSSVANPEAISNVRKIISEYPEGTIVVVSALGGVTDALLKTAETAYAGNKDYEKMLSQVAARHYDMVREMVPADTCVDINRRVYELFDELSNIFKGIYLIRDFSARSSDIVVSYGERLSSLILSGIIPGSELCDSREFIRTRNRFGRSTVDFDRTNPAVQSRFENISRTAIVPGFISSDVETGEVTNLGRGGSDYTAAIIASALGAEMLEIWTDVDGFMTADPRMVPTAYVIDELSYSEAIELCNVGAKVIYPPTIFPVFHAGIPITVRNTFNPSSPGTYISRDISTDSTKEIRGISSLSDTTLLTVEGLGMVGIIGVNYRIFRSLAKAGISVFFVAQAASENNTSIGVRSADADYAERVLNQEFSAEIDQGEINRIRQDKQLSTVAVVGENMKRIPGIAGKLFDTLGRNGVNVMSIAQGASETNISFVVKLSDQRKAMNVIHDSFFLSPYQVINVFLAGVGQVGSRLLDQIRGQQNALLENNSLQIKVLGISNSKKYIIDREGIDLENYSELLERSEDSACPEKFRDDIIKMNIFNSVFVDCTANADISNLYGSFLQKSISVVAANKTAASSAFENYARLKETARISGAKFLFETNVGAGLPVINTINDLRNSGDRILKIEAVVSGTLNYIFDTMSSEVPISRAVELARDNGYSEPDPRVDLSGADVVKKLVILAREAGYKIECGDVLNESFLPEEFFHNEGENFLECLRTVDKEFELRRSKMEDQGLKWRFIARFENMKGQVSLEDIDSGSPFFELAGSNNIVCITTERYKEHPLQIKGYGAGAEVTAAGVFADIISIANIH